MIYKGHDIRFEKQHFRITNLKTGFSWTEDSLVDAKHEIDLINDIKESLPKEAEKIEKSI